MAQAALPGLRGEALPGRERDPPSEVFASCTPCHGGLAGLRAA